VAEAGEREDALRRSEERLQAVIAASPVAIVEVDLQTRVTRWNPAAEEVFGWSADEILGRAVPFVPPDREAEFELLLARIRAGEAYSGFETVRRRRDGTLVDVEIAAAPVRDPDGRVVSHMVVFSDITRRKRQEAELQRLNEELRSRLDELAASRSRIVEAGDAERRRLERNLHDGAQQRFVTVALTLRLATRLEQVPAEAGELIERALDELSLGLAELRELARGLHPAILTEHGLDTAVRGLAGRAPVAVDVLELPRTRMPARIEAAAYYLVAESLTNVVKYARATAATVSIAPRADRLVVEVCDDGAGGADAARGSGLRGLADRVEALGGRLALTSPPGGGTTVRAELPLG
jgi:PAS domain S-box-containing protein